MLRAHLEHKFGKVIARALGDVDEAGLIETSWRSRIRRDEDSLTSSVFERLSYLEPKTAWNVLRCACVSAAHDTFPAFPTGETEWRFWPSLSPAAGDRNENSVEPDVLLLGPSYAVIVESKHRAEQHFGQWVSQVRAARASLKTSHVVHISVGGCSLAQHQEQTGLAQVTLARHAEAHASFFYLSWRRLGAELLTVLRSPEAHAGQRRLVQAMLDALVAWGYGTHLWLQSLPAPSVTINSTALVSWRPTTNRPFRPDFADLPLSGITRTPQALLRWRVR